MTSPACPNEASTVSEVDNFPEGWKSAAVKPGAPGWYERCYTDGICAHHWNGQQWSSTKNGAAHWRQLADAPYPLWRELPLPTGAGVNGEQHAGFWIATEARGPVAADGNRFGDVYAWRADGSNGCTAIVSVRHFQQYSAEYSHWARIPAPGEQPAPDGDRRMADPGTLEHTRHTLHCFFGAMRETGHKPQHIREVLSEWGFDAASDYFPIVYALARAGLNSSNSACAHHVVRLAEAMAGTANGVKLRELLESRVKAGDAPPARVVAADADSTAPLTSERALLACAAAFERSADWLDNGTLQGAPREFPLVGTRDYRIAAEAIRRLAEREAADAVLTKARGAP
jgi:hypothetical protein